MKSTEDRFWTKVDKSGGEDASWPWLGFKNPDGYGIFFPDKTKCRRAHRIAYALLVRTIPDGMQLDHHGPQMFGMQERGGS